MTIGDDIVVRQGQRIADLAESLRLAVQQRSVLEDRYAELVVSLTAAEASRDVAIQIVERCRDSYALLEKELEIIDGGLAFTFLGYTAFTSAKRMKNQREVCANWVKALTEWLATKDAPRKK